MALLIVVDIRLITLRIRNISHCQDPRRELPKTFLLVGILILGNSREDNEECVLN